MTSRAVFIGACAVLLCGCDLVRVMLPRQATTAVEARAALERCGVAPDSIAWSVSADGTFAFGRKRADAEPMEKAQSNCVMRWVEDEKIKLAFIGWETGPR